MKRVTEARLAELIESWLRKGVLVTFENHGSRVLIDETNNVMSEAATEIEKMRAALKVIHNMYQHAWDLTDGGLMMMGASVPKFGAAHKAVRDALGIKWLE